MAFNVLVVDDSTVMRSMIIKTLRLSGVPINELYQAANGMEGLKVLDEHWIDLVLVDINMPVMDGEEMIDRVRGRLDTADLAMVVISTESSDTRINSIQSKGVEFIHKPFTPEILRETITRITGVNNEPEYGESAFSSSSFDF